MWWDSPLIKFTKNIWFDVLSHKSIPFSSKKDVLYSVKILFPKNKLGKQSLPHVACSIIMLKINYSCKEFIEMEGDPSMNLIYTYFYTNFIVLLQLSCLQLLNLNRYFSNQFSPVFYLFTLTNYHWASLCNVGFTLVKFITTNN